MEMWAGTNRIGFDSFDSLSSSWLEFYSTSPLASHHTNVGGGNLKLRLYTAKAHYSMEIICELRVGAINTRTM